MINKLIDGLKSEDIKSIAKVISIIENESSKSEEIIDRLFPLTNNSYRIGITGPPGAGKSTITNLLIKKFRKLNKKVGVLLVDPSSPFSGGAILGDRIRMNMHYKDPHVYVRSVASRGSRGGLASNINEIADVLDVAGFDIIIFETVGVGQIEIDVVEHVDSVVLVLVPESGDDIQMMKAGIIEIADIFVINKSDRSDSDKLCTSISNIIDLSKNKKNNWTIPIIKTVATKDDGIQELTQKLLDYYKFVSKITDEVSKINQRYLNKIQNILIKQTLKKISKPENKKIIDKECLKKYTKRLSPNSLIKKLL